MRANISAIGLVVQDMAGSLAFYRRLGLDIPPEADREAHVEYALPGGLRLFWDTVETVRGFDPEWTEPSGGPRVSLAFELSDPEAVDTLYRELTAAGYHGQRAPWDAVWGQRYAVLHDPDGNGVDLFAPLPARTS